MIERLRTGLERVLEAITGLLVVALAVIVVLGVVYRKLGASLVWYDEVASVTLAWLTYYGAALAALKRAHIGFPGVVDAMTGRKRVALILLGETIVVGFFVLLAVLGVWVLDALRGDTLVSLPMVPVELTQSIIPIGAALFVIAELLSIPKSLGTVAKHREVKLGAEGSLE